LLEQAIQLFERIRDARERMKGLPELVGKYVAEANQTKSIVELVRHEKDLWTPGVGVTIGGLNSVGKTLLDYLEIISATKGPVQDFFHQLVSGKKGEDKLESIMKELGNAKLNLSVQIQIANVGLIRGVNEAVYVNINAVKEMNKTLLETLGTGHRLRISELIRGRSLNG